MRNEWFVVFFVLVDIIIIIIIINLINNSINASLESNDSKFANFRESSLWNLPPRFRNFSGFIKLSRV